MTKGSHKGLFKPRNGVIIRVIASGHQQLNKWLKKGEMWVKVMDYKIVNGSRENVIELLQK